MAEPLPFEERAEALKLRSQPKPTTRINRKVVMFGAGIGLLLMFLAVSVAFDPPTLDDGTSNELYVTSNQPTAEALNSLPVSYTDMPQETPIILGEPFAGDLGATIAQVERDLGIVPVQDDLATDFRPNPEREAERAERIRQAKLAQESAAAPIHFQLQGRSSTGAFDQSGQPSQADFDASPFSALTASAGSPPSGFAGSGNNRDPNFQDSKSAFANTARDDDIYNPHDLQDAVSPYQVMTGTIIPASLITGLNSDLPGSVIAQITQPVYDTATGAHVLIPQGARLIGRYDSQVSFGQSRALVVWDRIIFPDTSSIQIEALPGADQSGFAGLRDRVDNHYGRLFGAVGLATILGVGTELTFGDDESDLVEAIRDSAQDSSNQAGQRIVDRNLNIQPTLKVRPGWPLRVIVTRDLILRPYTQAGLR